MAIGLWAHGPHQRLKLHDPFGLVMPVFCGLLVQYQTCLTAVTPKRVVVPFGAVCLFMNLHKQDFVCRPSAGSEQTYIEQPGTVAAKGRHASRRLHCSPYSSPLLGSMDCLAVLSCNMPAASDLLRRCKRQKLFGCELALRHCITAVTAASACFALPAAHYIEARQHTSLHILTVYERHV